MDVVQETSWYLRPDGSLEMILLLAAFQEFFAEHSEAWLGALLPPGSSTESGCTKLRTGRLRGPGR